MRAGGRVKELAGGHMPEATTLRISELQGLLEKVKSQYGDLRVYISRDTEGNGYGAIAVNRHYWDKKKLILFPYKEYVELKSDER